MHTGATWLELASRARLVADSMSDPSERTAMLDIAADYEQQARGDLFLPGNRAISRCISIADMVGNRRTACSCGSVCYMIPLPNCVAAPSTQPEDAA